MAACRRTLATLIATTLLAGTAWAGELKQVGTITVPGTTLTNFDVSFVNEPTGQYLFSDRSNSAIDIFDANTDSFVGRVGGFRGAVMKGAKINNDVSGPDGVIVADGMIWAGDGDSTVKIFDLASLKLLATVASGGKARLDEMAFDPKDHVFIGVNNADDVPFATLFSTEGDYRILGKVVFQDATGGAEQPAYNPVDGMFYEAIPELNKDPKKGAVAVIDPRTTKLVKMIPVEDCHTAGLAFGPNHNFVLGCNADGKQMPAVTVVMNADSGAVVATVAGLGGADVVNYNARNNQYYTASRLNPGGPVLGVIDAGTNTLVQKIAITGGYPHSVMSSEANGYVYLPVAATGGGDGTIHVFAPAQ